MNRFVSVLIGILLAFGLGCSTHNGPVEPIADLPATQSPDTHTLWGLWQFTADIENQTLDAVQLRHGDFHLNALRFLEPPVNLYLTIENIQFNGNIVDVDVKLRHPFLGQNQFTGFDACGILITNGSVSSFQDPDLLMTGGGDVRLLNPDGYTRWWNPAEFPHTDTMFGYKDGLQGVPDSVADYNSTLNPYKFFCDDISLPDDPLSSLDPASRCVFSAGQSNSRHYTIEFTPGALVFNYAIDACWKFPVGSPPWDVPDDFPSEANRVEAWNVVVTELENTLWHDDSHDPPSGGDLSLSIDIWDHFDADLNTVIVESPGNFNPVSASTPVGGGDGFSTYTLDITYAIPKPDEIELLITVQSQTGGYQGLLPGKNVSAYFTHTSPVADEPPAQEECGEGIYNSCTKVTFKDHPGSLVKYELAWLMTGPYTGEMLVLAGSGKIGRYNMDTITDPDGEIFCELPPPAITPPPNPGLVFHIEVEPITGRVLTVGNSPNGQNNSILVYNDLGVLLTPEEGISVGPSGRKIQAMDIDENGDLWMMTGTDWLAATVDTKLERWFYQDDAPYYVYDPSSDLDTDEILGQWHESSQDYIVHNDIADIIISHEVDRMFIFQQAHMGEHNGRLYVWDMNPSGPPTYRDDLYNGSLFSQPTYRGFNGNHKATYGDIWIDRSVPELDYCRILIYGRRHPDLMVMLIRLDAEDCSITNETVLNGLTSPYTLGINEDTDPAKRNVVFVNYPTDRCYMGPPVDW